MPTLERRRMSWEDYLALPQHPHAEWVDGEVVVTPSASFAHQRVSRRVANLLEAHLPRLFVVEAVNLRLPGNRVRIPDIVVVPDGDHGVFVETTPVLVVEILSSSTRGEDMMRKGPEYAAAGIEQYWLVDLDDRWLEVSANVDGRWELVARVDEHRPTGEVVVGEHGTVPLDLAHLLDT